MLLLQEKVIYHHTMTPAWLKANASYLHSSATVTGGELKINAFRPPYAAIIKVPLISAVVFQDDCWDYIWRSQITSTLASMVTATSHMVCQTVKSLSGFKLLIGGIMEPTLPGIEWKGHLGQLYHPDSMVRWSPNPAMALSILVSLSSLSSWMSALAHATPRMTQDSWGPLATITNWCPARDSPWKSTVKMIAMRRLESSLSKWPSFKMRLRALSLLIRGISKE